MKKFLILYLIVHLNVAAFCQVIRGTVLEKGSKTSICFATIYFNGTFAGTSSDKNGNFAVDISQNKSKPLTISAIGYYSVTISNLVNTKPLIIYLEPKVYEIRETVVNENSLRNKRARNLAIFRDEFLGTNENSYSCKILNEEDITFNYESDADTIKAYASKPLRIENLALGYKITYYLDKFEYYKKDLATFFSGNIIFTEDLGKDEAEGHIYKSRRELAYLGSKMHFFRALATNSIDSSGFVIKNPEMKLLGFLDVVFQDSKHNLYIGSDKDIYITYDRRFKSIIEFQEKYVYFDESGFFNPGILWKGKMAYERISNWLPYEYIYKPAVAN
jgi:hypothetical protein